MARGECGTYAGAMAHNAARTPMCDDCKRAHADYITGLLIAAKEPQHDPRRCRACGSVFREHKCQAVTRG